MAAFVLLVAIILLLVAAGTWARRSDSSGRSAFADSPSAPIPTIPALTSRPVAPVVHSAPPRRANLAEKLGSIDWYQFEKLMEIAYRKRGFEVDRRGGANPDGGIDLVLMKGADKIGVQCKHWRKWKVAVPKIRELVGAMADAKISKGVLVTISDIRTMRRPSRIGTVLRLLGTRP